MSCGEQSCTWIFRILCFGQTSVLKYIRNQTSRFKVFVANRVSEILVSQLSQWRCVDTARNSVDVASRGLKVDAFLKNVTCVSGPQFLIQPESVWPVNPEDVHQLQADDPEVKKAVAVNAAQAAEEVSTVTRIIKYFSSWTGLKKSVAWILRFKKLLLACCQKRRKLKMHLTQSGLDLQQRCSLEMNMDTFKGEAVSSCLSLEELEKAELEITIFCQRKRFPEELSRLQSPKTVKGCSQLL